MVSSLPIIYPPILKMFLYMTILAARMPSFGLRRAHLAVLDPRKTMWKRTKALRERIKFFAQMGPNLGVPLFDPPGSPHVNLWPQGTTFSRDSLTQRLVLLHCHNRANPRTVWVVNELAMMCEVGHLGYPLASCKNKLCCQKQISEWISLGQVNGRSW